MSEKIDHITCHADGTFHIKTPSGKEVYRDSMKRTEPLGAKTTTFLEFIVITDDPDKYKMATTIPAYPHVFVDHTSGIMYMIEGRFSGSNYPDLVTDTASRFALTGARVGAAVLIGGATLKGALTFLPFRVPQGMSQRGRLDGTIILFKFPTAQDRYLIKGFSIV